MTMGNGWTVSVQFGLANYCDRYLRLSATLADTSIPIDWNAPRKDDFWDSYTAEIAAWYGDREDHMGMTNWYNFGNDQVRGYCTADEVVEFLGMVAALPARILQPADYNAPVTPTQGI